MALLNGIDSWLLEYDACETLSREIMEQLHARDREPPGSFNYDSISGRTRVRLKQYSNEVSQLKGKLQQASVISTLTAEEKERRLRQVEQLQSRCVQLEGQFGRPTNAGRSSGRNVVVDMGTTGWGNDDDEEEVTNTHSAMPVTDLRTQQAQMLREQDAGLEGLSQVIARQKRIATAITEEVDDQNEILDDISNNMDRVDTRVRGGTDLIKTIGRKDATCGYWVIIIILLIVILAVGFS